MEDVSVEGGVRVAIYVDGVQMRDWSAEEIVAFFSGLAAAIRAAQEPDDPAGR